MSESRIIVGVDGSDSTVAALRWGLTESKLRGCTLVAMHAYRLPVYGVEQVLTPMPVVDLAPAARALVTEQVRRARTRATAHVKVEEIVCEGSAGRVLVGGAGPDDVIVVGSRGHRGLAGLLLGSTGQYVATHATCPVVVVHGQKAEVTGRQPATIS